MIVAPLVSRLEARPLDSPEPPLGRVVPGRDAPARFLHLVRECMQDAHDDHPICAAVQTAVNRGRDLMPAVEHSGMRKDNDTTGSERRREVPLAAALQPLERSAFAQLVVLGAIQLVDVLLELLGIEGHVGTGDARLLALTERAAAPSRAVRESEAIVLPVGSARCFQPVLDDPAGLRELRARQRHMLPLRVLTV